MSKANWQPSRIFDVEGKFQNSSSPKLYFISNNFDDVSIYGFDGGDEKYEYYHYYTHSDDRTTKYMNRPTRFDHDLSIERKCMDIIKKTYSLKNLNE